jgi:invasion protein IalB
VYDSWTVTCRDSVGGALKKTCFATLRVASQDRREILLNWDIAVNKDGRFVTGVHAPIGLTLKKDNKIIGGGILIQNGIDLKFGNNAARRLNYVSCNPQQCFAESPIDEAFVKEATASSTATLTVYAATGEGIPFEVPIKGIDKAIAATRK